MGTYSLQAIQLGNRAVYSKPNPDNKCGFANDSVLYYHETSGGVHDSGMWAIGVSKPYLLFAEGHRAYAPNALAEQAWAVTVGTLTTHVSVSMKCVHQSAKQKMEADLEARDEARAHAATRDGTDAPTANPARHQAAAPSPRHRAASLPATAKVDETALLAPLNYATSAPQNRNSTARGASEGANAPGRQALLIKVGALSVAIISAAAAVRRATQLKRRGQYEEVGMKNMPGFEQFEFSEQEAV
jgi:hypothetical protein